MIELGDKITFKPHAYFENPAQLSMFGANCPTVTGEVIYINEEHRYYRVQWRAAAGCICHECFKF